jgi:hypothetical protein
MSDSRETVGFTPTACLARQAGRGDQFARRSQPVINHTCFNSLNEQFPFDKFCVRGNFSMKPMISLGYLYRGIGPSQRPKKLRDVLSRGVAVPCADRRE